MESFLGQIILFAGNYAPEGWLICAGQSLQVSQYQALYSIIGTAYGGDSVNFRLPDLQGRVAIGTTSGANIPGRVSPVLVGAVGGVPTVSLTVAALPMHSHTAAFVGSAGASSAVPVAIPAVSAAATGTATATPGTTTVLANSVSTSNSASTSATTPSTLHATTTTTTNTATATDVYSTGTADTTLKPFNLTVPGSVAAGTVTVGNTGGSVPFSALPPYQTINYIICVSQGIYPSRP